MKPRDDTLEKRVIILSSSEPEKTKLQEAVVKATERTRHILRKRKEVDDKPKFLEERVYTLGYQTPERLLSEARDQSKTPLEGRFVILANLSDENIALIQKLKAAEMTKSGWPIESPVIFISERPGFDRLEYSRAMEIGAFDIVSYSSPLELGNIIEAAFKGYDRRLLLAEEGKTASSLTASRMHYPRNPVAPATPAILLYYQTPRKTMSFKKKNIRAYGPAKKIAKALTEEGFIIRYTNSLDNARLIRQFGQPNIIFLSIFDRASLEWYQQELEALTKEDELTVPNVNPTFVIETSAKFYGVLKGNKRGRDILLPPANDGTLLPSSISDQLVQVVDRLWQREELSKAYMWMEAGFPDREQDQVAIEKINYLNTALADRIDLQIVIPDTLHAVRFFLSEKTEGYSIPHHEGEDYYYSDNVQKGVSDGKHAFQNCLAITRDEAKTELERLRSLLSEYADRTKVRLQFSLWSDMAREDKYIEIYRRIKHYLVENPNSELSVGISDVVRRNIENNPLYNQLGEQEKRVIGQYHTQNILHRLTAAVYLHDDQDRNSKMSDAYNKRFDNVLRLAFQSSTSTLRGTLETEAKVNFIYRPD